MRGVIAAGSTTTADAGAEILALGGNAVDAAVAACFATAAGEPALTSLAGGGVMIHRNGATGDVTISDFFADAPRARQDDVPGFDFVGVDLDFGPTTQRFHIGRGAAAVPGVIPGLCGAVDRWGSLPLAEIVKPACRALREGVPVDAYQGFACKLLGRILTHTEGARRVFGVDGRSLAAGDVFRSPLLADALTELGQGDWRAYYRDVVGRAIALQLSPEQGGLITREDLEAYRVEEGAPLRVRYGNATVLTNPPPGAGGAMIALMLRLLDASDARRHAPDSREYTEQLIAAMCVADESRDEGVAALADRFEAWRARYFELLSAGRPSAPKGPGGPASTTHVSVLDEAGNAAALTFSYGEGNGHVLGSTAIMMNNLMGEEDLHPNGFGRSPTGTRLSTMMSPSLVLHDDGAITVLGTGGANRIRTALVQAIALLERGYDPERCVATPRIHYEDGVLNAEVFARADGGANLAPLAARKFVPFAERSLYFGGVHAVRRAADGTLSGAGDPRRGGAFRRV